MKINKTSKVSAAAMLVAATIALFFTPQRAGAIPAYSNRTGLPCASCHDTTYARLTKTGWIFRRLGYRLPAEMDTRFQTISQKKEEESHYGIDDTLSIMARMRHDSIDRDGAKKFSQFYVNNIIGFLSGPVGKGWGYFLEPVFLEHAPTFVKVDNRFELPESEFEMEFATVKLYSGKPDRFFSAKLGQFGFGGIDGFAGNDRPIATGRPQMFTSTFNAFSQDATQVGGDVGFTAGANHFGFAALNGVNFEGKGDEGRPTNDVDCFLQGIHWFDNEGSSVQLLYYKGKTPLDDAGTVTDDFHRIYALANWRKTLSGDRGFNLVAGSMTGTHDRFSGQVGSPVKAGKFDVASGFAELDYELKPGTAFYGRFDALHSDEVPYGGTTFGGNPNRNTKATTFGLVHMLTDTIRSNVEFVNVKRDPGKSQRMIRFQLWFMW